MHKKEQFANYKPSKSLFGFEEFIRDKSLGYINSVIRNCKKLKKLDLLWGVWDRNSDDDMSPLVRLLEETNVDLRELRVHYVCIPNPSHNSGPNPKANSNLTLSCL